MAKETKRKKPWKPVPTTVTVTPGETAPPEEDADLDEERDPAALQEDDDVEEVLAALPHEARVELSRWSEQVQDYTYAGRYPVQGFTLDMVARKFGPGRFRMVIRGPVDGKMRLRAKRVFHIDPGLAPSPSAAPDAAGGLGLSVAELLKLQMEMLRTSMTQPRESMSDVVRTVAELMKPAAPAQALGVKEVLELMAALNNRPATGTSVEDVLAVLEKGIALAEGREPEDGLSAFGKAAAGLVAKLSEQREPPAPAPVAPPAKPPLQLMRPESPAPPTPPAPTAAVDPVQDFFNSITPVLRRAWQNEGDPELYANVLVDQIPAELDDAVENWINLPDYPEPLLMYFPGIAPEWLRRVLLEARILLTTVEDDDAPDHLDPAAAGGPRHPSDPGGHAPPGQ